ncbi:MAG: hypothetical protein Q7T01_02340 [bacterium]|nr:hypothetical protein [bacterium]
MKLAALVAVGIALFGTAWFFTQREKTTACEDGCTVTGVEPFKDTAQYLEESARLHEQARTLQKAGSESAGNEHALIVGYATVFAKHPNATCASVVDETTRFFEFGFSERARVFFYHDVCSAKYGGLISNEDCIRRELENHVPMCTAKATRMFEWLKFQCRVESDACPANLRSPKLIARSLLQFVVSLSSDRIRDLQRDCGTSRPDGILDDLTKYCIASLANDVSAERDEADQRERMAADHCATLTGGHSDCNHPRATH